MRARTPLRVCAAASNGWRCLTAARRRLACRLDMRLLMRRCRAVLPWARCMRCSPGGRQSAAATGFVAGLVGRVTARRPLVWVRQDFTEIESGAVSISGLAELGLDPRLVVTVRAADAEVALRTAADALACDALGAVVLEVWGQARPLDLVASRKLTLAAQASGVTGLLLRVAAEPQPSTAETRWIVRAAHSPPAAAFMAATGWGAPVFDAQLVRNRHGPVGRWIMEWKCDECLFNEPSAYPQPVAAAPAHRPYQAPARGDRRRTADCNWAMIQILSVQVSWIPVSSSPSSTTCCKSMRWTKRPRVWACARHAARQCPRHLSAIEDLRCR